VILLITCKYIIINQKPIYTSAVVALVKCEARALALVRTRHTSGAVLQRVLFRLADVTLRHSGTAVVAAGTVDAAGGAGLVVVRSCDTRLALVCKNKTRCLQ